MFGAQIDRAHDHAGGAVAALQTVAFFERSLPGVQAVVRLGQTFDGGDLLALDFAQQHIA